MLIFITVKNLRKFNFNIFYVMFSSTLTMFFLMISKINIKFSNVTR